jgi:hypothetical protein
MGTHTEFQYSIDMVTIDDENVIEQLGAVVDLQVAFATYRAACERWPGAAITLRQGAQIIEKPVRLRFFPAMGPPAFCRRTWAHTEALPVSAGE